jgi:hypothetical protein
VDDGGWNGSLELLLQTVRSGRGCTRRSGVQTNTRSCQGGAQGREEGSRAERRGRGVEAYRQTRRSLAAPAGR